MDLAIAPANDIKHIRGNSEAIGNGQTMGHVGGYCRMALKRALGDVDCLEFGKLLGDRIGFIDGQYIGRFLARFRKRSSEAHGLAWTDWANRQGRRQMMLVKRGADFGNGQELAFHPRWRDIVIAEDLVERCRILVL
jgi:hypothetical protein